MVDEVPELPLSKEDHGEGVGEEENYADWTDMVRIS